MFLRRENRKNLRYFHTVPYKNSLLNLTYSSKMLQRIRIEKYTTSLKNNYPIILVHGHFGWAPDQNKVLGKYFNFALKSKHNNEDVYIASVSPIAGVHDRACELYQ